VIDWSTEHVGRSGLACAVVGLVAVDPVAALSSRYAPTASVSPDSETEEPKLSPAPVFDALRYACWVHVVPLRTNTPKQAELVAHKAAAPRKT